MKRYAVAVIVVVVLVVVVQGRLASEGADASRWGSLVLYALVGGGGVAIGRVLRPGRGAAPATSAPSQLRDALIAQRDALAESEARFRELADAMPQIVYSCDAEARVDFANRQWLDYTGQADAQTGDLASVVHPDDLGHIVRRWEEAIATGSLLQAEFRLRRASDGAYRWFLTRAVPVRDATGRVVKWFGTSTDIHDQKRTEQQLAESEARFRTLFTTMDEGFCVIEVEFDTTGRALDYRVELMNPAFEHHTGMRGLVGRSIRAAIPELEEFWFETYGRVAATGEPARFVHRAAPMGGRWFDVSAFRIGGDGSRRVAILFNDISGRKLAEAERERLLSQLREQDRRKDVFLATLAHELRNPLAPLRTGLQVIQLAGADGTIEKARAMMDRQLVQLTRLVDDLLDASRVSTGKLELRPERLDLCAVIESALETTRPLIDQSRHTLRVEVATGQLHVDGDPVRLSQVVANLLTNAAKYTPPGGNIRLTTAREGAWALVTVVDDGIGIPAEMLESIFELFMQVDRTLERTTGGLGIGLSLVKGLVEMHGGTIVARSAGAGQGTTIEVRLPLAPPSIQDVAPHHDDASPAGPNVPSGA